MVVHTHGQLVIDICRGTFRKSIYLQNQQPQRNIIDNLRSKCQGNKSTGGNSLCFGIKLEVTTGGALAKFCKIHKKESMLESPF